MSIYISCFSRHAIAINVAVWRCSFQIHSRRHQLPVEGGLDGFEALPTHKGDQAVKYKRLWPTPLHL